MKKIGGNTCLPGSNDGSCLSVLNSRIEPSYHTVSDTVNFSISGYDMKDIELPDFSPSSFGSKISGGNSKLNMKKLNKVIESTYLIMSNKYYKNVKTDLRKVLKNQKEKFIKKV